MAQKEYEDGIPVDESFRVGQDEMLSPGNGHDSGENINCILAGNHVQGSFFAGIQSEYSGPAIEFRTKAGARFSVTPNHPVLTLQGFVPACLLSQGDDVIGYRGIIYAEPPTPGVHKNHNPALVEDVFKALSIFGSSRMVNLTPDDFHGDARGVIGKVTL
jgi:hypothetical protein